LPTDSAEKEISPPQDQVPQSIFLILNVWVEQVEGGRVVWRGQVQHVDRAITHAFEDWPHFVDLIANALDTYSTCAGRIQRELGTERALTEKSSRGDPPCLTSI
jgi:hypothetical protein